MPMSAAVGAAVVGAAGSVASSYLNNNNTTTSGGNSKTQSTTTSSTNSQSVQTSQTSSTSEQIANSVVHDSGTTTSTTKSIVDPTILAEEEAAAKTAGDNAANGSAATQGVVDNIFTQARNAFSGTVSQQTASGLYNSSTIQNLQTDAQAQATAAASQAVLNYQTGQQQIQASILNSILEATKSTQTTGTTSSTQTGQTDTTTQSIADTISALIGQTQSTATSNTAVQQQATQQKSSSVVCTELKRQGRISKELWKIGMIDLLDYPVWSQVAYRKWATPLAQHLRAHPFSRKSSIIAWIFTRRLLWLAAGRPLNHTGLLCNLAICAMAFPTALLMLLQTGEISEKKVV